MLRCGEGVRSVAEASAGSVTRPLLAVVPQGRHRNRRHASPAIPNPHSPVLPSGKTGLPLIATQVQFCLSCLPANLSFNVINVEASTINARVRDMFSLCSCRVKACSDR